jgi:hypothetical protein
MITLQEELLFCTCMIISTLYTLGKQKWMALGFLILAIIISNQLL